MDKRAVQDIPLEQPVSDLTVVNIPVEELLNSGLLLGKEEAMAAAFKCPLMFPPFFCKSHSNNNIK